MKRRTRQESKARRADRKAQADADAEVRNDWLAAVHGDPATLELIAGDSDESQAARDAVLRADEAPDGVTHAMLISAAMRALGL